MVDLLGEFKALVSALTQGGVEYALCGGLAMAVHGFARSTIDIDLLIQAESEEEVKRIARTLGYTIEAQPMSFAGGAVEIRRLSKILPESGFVLSLDLLLVTPETEFAWETRSTYRWGDQALAVVSRQGLIALKSLRNSGQDQDDMKLLKEVEDES